MSDTAPATQEPDPRYYTFNDAAQGKDIYNFFGNRVIEHTTSSGHVLAVKIKSVLGLDRSEADMMDYAATNGVLAPRVRAFYVLIFDEPMARAMVSDRVPGVPLVDVWDDLSDAQKASTKDQLRHQLARMRACTQPFVGRVGRQPTRNVYDSIVQTYCGPFDDQKAFDNWCLDRLRGGPLVRWKWRRVLEQNRRDAPASGAAFVLTHGDLTPRNIIVQDGVITGIIDWERSGFFPEYAEYAFAMALCHEHEKWWIPVLKEVMEPCSEQMVKFTRLVENRGF